MSQPEISQIQITELILEHRTALYGFILAAIPNAHVAEDIFQDVCVVICQKFHTHDPEKSFRAWAFGIARNKILQYFEKEQRRTALLTDPALLDKIAASPTWDEGDPAEKEALRECLEKLTRKVRRMLRLRYFENMSVASIAKRLGWSARSISVAMSRARTALMECVDNRLSLNAQS